MSRRTRERHRHPEHLPPRPVPNGIRIRSQHGEIGETWWSRRWLGLLESFGMGPRLRRGRSYARQGQVVSLDVQPGLVRALVQGSRPKPYTITVRLKALRHREWELVARAMAARAVFAAKLLAGEMPRNIEEVFARARQRLFPRHERDLNADCSCPDWAVPCKHIAAVLYVLAERFDQDPFLMFKLRGRTREEIVAALRRKRSRIAPLGAPGPAPEPATEEQVRPLEASIAEFWRHNPELDTVTTRGFVPEVDKAVLKRLGRAPFDVGALNLNDWLAAIYEAASAAALNKAAGN